MASNTLKLRIVFSETNIKILLLDVAELTIDYLKQKISQLGNMTLSEIDVIQYKDKDFDDYVNLTNVDIVESHMTLKVIKKLGTQQAEDQPEPCTSSLRSTGWPKNGFNMENLPSFESDIQYALKCEMNKFEETGKTALLRKQMKTKILDCLANTIYNMCAYPTRDKLVEVAKALVSKYPCLGDKVSATGCDVWTNSLVYKMGNFRSQMRNLGMLDVSLNGKRRGRHQNQDALPPAKAIRKGRRGEVNWQPNLPDGEDSTSMANHQLAMISEFRKSSPDEQKLKRLMDLTYAQRRLDINEEMTVARIIEKWPALFTPVEIFREYGRLVNNKLAENVAGSMLELRTGFLEILNSMKSGKSLQPISTELDRLANFKKEATTTDCEEQSNTTMLRCIPLYFHEDAAVLYRDFEETIEDTVLTQDDDPPHIAVIGNPMNCTDHRIVIEQNVVIRNISTFLEAVSLFLGIIYILNLRYNAVHSFQFIQKGLLKLPDKITSKKASSLLAKLRR